MTACPSRTAFTIAYKRTNMHIIWNISMYFPVFPCNNNEFVTYFSYMNVFPEIAF